ncbi:Rrf2 family transcriptional regulator [Cohnella nanjingensis]|uniref:Rrf2 family transcriptional regulator n=2 Tax=Cohnella nanjingensis TaxID=1387779 RepID=A0A7X0VG31_9BACL|nr:Rrf2 family transcriptional regulator [Cohnella nanjingensis]
MSTTNRIAQIGPPRFGVAVHALAWLTQSGGVLSSAALASQVNSHATFLRRVLQTLAQSGLVEAREGRDGGYTLARSPDRITLADVYNAVRAECAGEQADDGGCGAAAAAAGQLDEVLARVMTDAEQRTVDHLRGYTIADILSQADEFAKPDEGAGNSCCQSAMDEI